MRALINSFSQASINRAFSETLHTNISLYKCIMQMSADLYKPMDAHEEAIGCQVSSDPAHLISMRQDLSVICSLSCLAELVSQHTRRICLSLPAALKLWVHTAYSWLLT